MTERSSLTPSPEPASTPPGEVSGSSEAKSEPELVVKVDAPSDTQPGTSMTPQVPSSQLKGTSTDAPTELALEFTPAALSAARDSLINAGAHSKPAAQGGTQPNTRDNPTQASTVQLRRVTVSSEAEALSDDEPAPRKTDQYVGYIIDGRYHIESLLAQGGMGVVYRGRHRLIDKPVAIKVLRPELADNREITQRFLTEAQAASSIGSEHIVNITDYGELPDGATYIVMEFLEGEALGPALEQRSEPMPIAEILDIARQVCDGLQHAHNAGIVHRDLKPDNIFLTHRGKQETFVKILDFGIAKVASSQNQLTRAGRIFGTPHYMSPEQARGEELDNRSDIYSMGVILYEMVSGRLPFEGENPLGVLTQHMYSDPRPLHEVCVFGRVGVGLEAIVSKCLLKEPWQRYGSMSELDEDLARAQRGEEPKAVEDLKRLSVSPPALKQRLHSKRRTGWWLTLLLFVGAGVAAAIAVPRRHELLEQWHTWVGREPVLEELEESEVDGQLSAVALVLSPVDAHVFRGKQDLGMMPITLRIRPGQRVKLTVQREGYVTKNVEIDGSEPRLVVELTPIAGASPATPVRAPQAPPQGKTRVITIDDENVAPTVAPPSLQAPDAGPRPARTAPASQEPAASATAAPPIEDILAPLEPELPPEPPEGPKDPEPKPSALSPSDPLPPEVWPPSPIPDGTIQP